MTIYPSRFSGMGKVLAYKADDVRTTVNGVRGVAVGYDYEATTRMAVIRQAVGNAFVRQWRAQLGSRFRVV